MEPLNKEELFTAIDETVEKISTALSSLGNTKINTIPFEYSWTAAQVVRHITRSIGGMVHALQSEATVTDRNITERVPHLQEIFLSTSNKFDSPEFILPEVQEYNTPDSIQELKQTVAQLKDAADKTHMDELVNGLPFGPVTKMEILHFVLYHTQRHLRQLEKICAVLPG